jgi:hypothetical protein
MLLCGNWNPQSIMNLLLCFRLTGQEQLWHRCLFRQPKKGCVSKTKITTIKANPFAEFRQRRRLCARLFITRHR